MKAFANIKSRYAEYKALDSADKVKAWKEGLINNAIYLLIIIAVIYTYTQNSRFLSVASIVNIISLSAANIPIACGIAGTIVLTGTDLSAGRVVGLTACISASLLQSVTYATKIFPDLPVLPIPLVILIVIVVGGIVGWVNGFFVAKFRKFITMDPDLNRIPHRRILYNRYFCSLDQSHIQKMLPECTISSYRKNRSCLSDL